MKGLRDDLALAAYAISVGYELRGHNDTAIAVALFDYGGIPPDSLQFMIGDVHVWSTARGWRVSRLVDGLYAKPADSDFFRHLKQALDEGLRNWRDRRTEVGQ